jgi:transposase
MRGEILGVERRRRWTDDEKLAVVLSVGVGGATVTQVAQRHDVRRQQIYAWRYDLKKKGLLTPDAETLFLPVEFAPMEQCAEISDPEPSSSAQVEVILRSGRRLLVNTDVDASALTRLIRAVEAA